jgi:chromosome segregation and condensation protein ScpB
VGGDPRTDTRAAAAHLVGVLWASASQGLTVKELRAAIGLSRERFEEAYEFLGTDPPLGLTVQRHGDELRLVTAPEVCSSVEAASEQSEARVTLERRAGGAGHRRLSAADCALGHRAHSWLGQRQRN